MMMMSVIIISVVSPDFSVSGACVTQFPAERPLSERDRMQIAAFCRSHQLPNGSSRRVLFTLLVNLITQCPSSRKHLHSSLARCHYNEKC